MSTLHDNASNLHYRRNGETAGKPAGKPLNVEGDIREHAQQLLRQAALRRQPGKSSFEVAISVATVTIDDFMKNGRILEASFVRDVRDELYFMLDEKHAADAYAEFDALDQARREPVTEWVGPEPPAAPSVPESDSPLQEFFDEFHTEPDEWAARRRHWRETYALLEPFERRVFLAGVAGLGVVAISVVSAVMGALL